MQLGVDYHTDYREMLRRDDVDVVAIFTPNASHQDLAIDAARAGKHVIVTKPLEITTKRIDAILDATRSAGVKLAVEYMARFEPGHYLGYRAIADGLVGKPILGEFSYKCFRPQEYYTGTRGTWAVDGGGAMMLQAIHTARRDAVVPGRCTVGHGAAGARSRTRWSPKTRRWRW